MSGLWTRTRLLILLKWEMVLLPKRRVWNQAVPQQDR